MVQISLKQFLVKLNKNLNTLQEREAKYAGNPPLELLNQIDDHKTAIDLTKQSIRGELTEAEWREALKPLLVAIEARSGNSEIASSVTIADIAGGIHDSTIVGGDVEGDVIKTGAYIKHATIITATPEAAPSDEAPAPGKSPFKGLQYFDQDDADLFFGRELRSATKPLADHLGKTKRDHSQNCRS